MRVERMLQFNVAIMAVLGTLLFGMGHPENSIKLPLMAAFVAFTSVVFTDGYGWFRLNRIVANIFAIIVAAYTLSKFYAAITAGDKLLEIANLLAYLQFILFYEEKSPRTYSHLMVLSLLQVVVAAALHLELAAGVILGFYVLSAMSTMMYFFLYREQIRVEFASGVVPSWFDARQAAALKRNYGPSAAHQRIQVSTDVQETIARQMTWKGLSRQVGAMSCVALVMSVILFYSLPRKEEQAWRGAPGAVASRVGFNDRVNLDQQDLISQDERAVMRVAFYDAQSNDPYPIGGEPYFRGAVLYDYDEVSSTWQPKDAKLRELESQFGQARQPVRELLWAVRPDRPNLVRQEVLLEPYEKDRLFAVFPVFVKAPPRNRKRDGYALYDDDARVLSRAAETRVTQGQFRFELWTTAFVDNQQVPIYPYVLDRGNASTKSFGFNETKDEETEQLLKIKRARYPTLVKTAQDVLEEAQVDPLDKWEIAFALQDHFRTTDIYTYTLDFRDLERDESLDPIEDFVKNHRTGHCQYFASSLAMMLRSQDIPARLVVGYKGGDYNVVGDYYQVKEKYAHAWVEAYLEPEQIKDTFGLPRHEFQTGAWVRLDPTPLSSIVDAEEYTVSIMERIDQTLDYFSMLWADYVLGFNSKRQKESLYNPLNEDTQQTFSSMLDPRNWWREPDDQSRAAAMTWVSWLSLLLAIVVGLTTTTFGVRLVLGVYGTRKGKRRSRLARLLSRMVGWMSPKIAQWIYEDDLVLERETQKVSFYERFVAMLEQHELSRQSNQTQREFAEDVASQFAAQPHWQHLADLPKRVVDAFYRVRFGDGNLSSHDSQSVEEALTQLQDGLQTQP